MPRTHKEASALLFLANYTEATRKEGTLHGNHTIIRNLDLGIRECNYPPASTQGKAEREREKLSRYSRVLSQLSHIHL